MKSLKFLSLGHANSCLLSIARYVIVRYGQESKILNLTRLSLIFIQFLVIIYMIGVKVLQMNYLDADSLFKEVSFVPSIPSYVSSEIFNDFFSNSRYVFLESLTIRKAPYS